MARSTSRVHSFLSEPCAWLIAVLFNIQGDVLEILEQRHDWATFNFTPELFKYVLTRLIPEVIVHSQSQDEEQVRDHYDRACHFLFPRILIPHAQRYFPSPNRRR